MTDNLIPLTAICISLLAVSLAIYLYFITKIFTLKEYREKKREAMFNWVHGNLIEDVYIPLTEYAGAISDELSQETPRKEIVLYRISKFLHYVFKNREIFGGDMYFTPNEDSNRAIGNISDKIISELNIIYYLPYTKNPTERRIVILEFLATCAKCRNYSEFELLISGKPIFNRDLTNEINGLKSAYNYLPFGRRDYINVLLSPVANLLNPPNLEQAWRKAKIYAYCSLFNKLVMYEIHKIYDSWYAEYPDALKYRQLIYVIDWVNNLVKKMDDKLKRYPNIGIISYSKPSSITYISDLLNNEKKKLLSATCTSGQIEAKSNIAQLELLMSIELFYIISPQKYEVLERGRSKEFYRYIITMDVSKNLLTKILKIRYWMVR